MKKTKLTECSYCHRLVDKVRPTPFLADINLGAMMCKNCWAIEDSEEIGKFESYWDCQPPEKPKECQCVKTSNPPPHCCVHKTSGICDDCNAVTIVKGVYKYDYNKPVYTNGEPQASWEAKFAEEFCNKNGDVNATYGSVDLKAFISQLLVEEYQRGVKDGEEGVNLVIPPLHGIESEIGSKLITIKCLKDNH